MASRAIATLAVLGALALAAAPLATAHTTVNSTDGQVRIVVGQLNEPVVTFAKTGLDICFTTNPADAAQRAPLTVNTGNLTATLVAPDNKTTLSQTLVAQFGRAGCYQFTDPYVLTVPGQYYVNLTGNANGHAVDLHMVKAGGAAKEVGNLQFPDAPATNDKLAKDNAALRADLDALKAQVTALEHDDHDAPSLAPMALLAGLACVAIALRGRHE